jgi:hypothetical protein
MELVIMRRIAVGLLIMLAFAGMAAPGSAQDLACPQFSSDQIAAQDYFEANGGTATNNFNNMDANGNGIACDEPGAFEGGGPSAGPEGGPSAGPEGCADFLTQEEAQTYFVNGGGTTGDDVLNLDADNNGVACDELGALGGPTAHSTECADYATQEEAQTALENGAGRYTDLHLDTDENGIACDEDEVTTGGENTLSPEGPGESAVVVSALPSTGSDPVRGSWSLDALFVGTSALLLIGTSILLRRAGAART